MSGLKCFVIMPYAVAFDPVFAAIRQAVTSAVPGESIECISLKEEQAAGRITDDIVSALHGAALCVADVTGIAHLIDYFRQNNRHVLLAFI